MCMSGMLGAAALAIRHKRQGDKASKTAERRQKKALKEAEAAQANAEASRPGTSRSLDLSTSMTAAKKAKGVQSTYLASRQPTQSTLGVA